MADANDNNHPAIAASPHGDAILYDSSTSDVEDDVSMVGQAIDFEIVGLYGSTNGRSCCFHKTCGKDMEVGNLLRLVKTIVEINGQTEMAIKLVRSVDGVDGCTIGFVPRVQSKLPKVVDCLDKFAVVRELYSLSRCTYKREKSAQNRGMASATLLDYITKDE
jgi:hypothetical protein